MDSIPRPSGSDFHVLYQSENLGNNGLRNFIDSFGYDDDNKEVDIEVNPLCGVLDEENESKDVIVDLDIPILEEPNTIEEDKENKLIEKNFGIVSKAMFGEVVLNTKDFDSEDIPLNGSAVETAPEENLKEIVETVKNAVLSYRTEHDNKSAECNANVIDIKKENCDNLDLNRLGDHNNCNDKGGGDRIVENGIADEDLNMYNSYNYWRINPDLPLDPTLIDAGRSPKQNIKMLEEHSLGVSITTFFYP